MINNLFHIICPPGGLGLRRESLMLILSSRVLKSLSRPSKKLLELNNYTMFSYTHSCIQIYSFILYYVAKEDRATQKCAQQIYYVSCNTRCLQQALCESQKQTLQLKHFPVAQLKKYKQKYSKWHDQGKHSLCF